MRILRLSALFAPAFSACSTVQPDWPTDIPAQPDCGEQRGCHVIDHWTDEAGQARETFNVVEVFERLDGMECGHSRVLVPGVKAVAVITLLPGTGPEVWRHDVMHTRGWTHDDMPALIDRCGR